jgi:WD40 repeat protein
LGAYVRSRHILVARRARTGSQGHKNAVLEIHWTASGEQVLSCSADKTVRCFDAQTGTQIKKLSEHKGVVNSVRPSLRGPQLFVSGADDSTVRLWDVRVKRAVATFTDRYMVTAVEFSERGDEVFAGGLDNTIKVICLTSPAGCGRQWGTCQPKQSLAGRASQCTIALSTCVYTGVGCPQGRSQPDA